MTNYIEHNIARRAIKIDSLLFRTVAPFIGDQKKIKASILEFCDQKNAVT